MGVVDFQKLFFCFCIIIIACYVPLVSYAQQYYDPTTRRYVTVNPAIRSGVVNRQNSGRISTARLPTRAEIEAENLRIQRENELEQQRLRQIRESSATQSRRRYDPNRYHKTEEIDFSPL